MLTLHIITDLAGGGAEAVLYRLVSADQVVRHVVVSLMDDGKYGPLMRAIGVECHTLDMPRGRLTVSGVSKLLRLVRTTQPDVVQTWMYHGDLVGGVIARLAGVRKVFWGVHNSTLERGKSKWSTRLVARLCGALSPWVPTYIVCPSGRAASFHARLGYAAARFSIIPNGYDLNVFRPDLSARERVRASLGIADGEFVIGMVGRFDPQKDHTNLLSALAIARRRMPFVRCVLAGVGLTEQNTELSHLIESHGLGGVVTLLGWRDDIRQVMSAFDVHALSSAYGEAFPNVVAEAMACCTPCIATDVGDCAAIIGQTGWVVAPRDSLALAAAMVEAATAAKHSADWGTRKSACRERIEKNFTLDAMIAAYHRVWSA